MELREVRVVTVTKLAMEKLEETLKELAADPDYAIRVIPSSTVPNQLDLVIDSEREDDQIVSSETGTKLLLIGSDIAEALEGMILDYDVSSVEAGFVIWETGPEIERR